MLVIILQVASEAWMHCVVFLAFGTLLYFVYLISYFLNFQSEAGFFSSFNMLLRLVSIPCSVASLCMESKVFLWPALPFSVSAESRLYIASFHWSFCLGWGLSLVGAVTGPLLVLAGFHGFGSFT